MKIMNLFLILSLFIFSVEAEESQNLPQNITTTEESFSKAIFNLDKTLTKFGNKRLAVLGFVTLDGPDFVKDAILISERFTQDLVSQGNFEVIDRTLLGIENVTSINPENAKNWQENLKLGSVLTGTVLRKSKDTLEVNWRLVELKNLTILASGKFLVKPDWGFKDTPLIKLDVSAESGPLDLLKKKINQIKLTNLDTETKQREILKTIAEFFKPSENVNYTYTYFPCSIADKYCETLKLRDGFYKIYYSNELVLTVDKDGKILESYYYGKNNPVRKDINLEF